MPQSRDFNAKFPENTRSSSSVSLNNESPITDDINYDSDISEDDDHAIAEGEDDEEEDEVDEGFEVEVSTLTGNTFSVMIQPQDTVEVLKTRIAFQEGISPADQNLVLEQGQGKLLDTHSTLEELNICRNFNNKLTLVTNVQSGGALSFKNSTEEFGNGLGSGPIERQHLWDSSPPRRLAPTITRRSNNLDLPQTHSTSTTSLRLPKILASNNNNGINNNYRSNSDASVNPSNSNPLEENSWRKSRENNNNDSLPEQLQREWMQSLFNRKVENGNAEEEKEIEAELDLDLEENGGVLNDDDDDDEDIDSTTGRMDSTIPSSIQNKTRYSRKNGSQIGEEDGNILVVQGDDGVILIIQKNSGVLEDSKNDDNVSIELGVHPGRIIPEMRRSRQRKGSETQSVQERIKENAVTLEKMRQVRSLMSQKKKTETPERNKSSGGGGGGIEFPKISDSKSSSSIKHNTLAVPSRKEGSGTGNGSRRSANTNGRPSQQSNSNSNRSINSSKMSLNRLIAEIYLQSKRKGYSFQPGQPPYTEQQLLKYVQLKVAILLDEQKKNKTEPCPKCITSNDWNWNFSESKPYLVPTVVMNRYKRLPISRSLDKEIEIELEESTTKPVQIQRRKSTIAEALNFVDKERRRSQIPRLVPGGGGGGGSNVTATNTATASTASTSTLSRRSSSSVPNGFGGGGGGMIPPILDRGRSVTNQYIIFNGNHGTIDDFDCDDNGDSDCNGNGQTQSIYLGGNKRPSFKIHPKVYTITTTSTAGSTGVGRTAGVGYTSKRSSRPGSSGKVGAGKVKKPAAVRCPVCKKKIAIANRYQCRCGLTFCPIHRYPESHECTFDYKTEGRNKIREANPVIVAKKITEI